MTNREGEGLKPCPFCRGRASHALGKRGDGTPWPYVECEKCGASAEPDVWNTRASGWQPIESAPKDGTPIQVKIPGHGSDNLIRWSEGFMDEHENPCGCWEWAGDNEPPECWTDGVCWASNEDHVASVQPTEWKLPTPAEQSEAAQ